MKQLLEALEKAYAFIHKGPTLHTVKQDLELKEELRAAIASAKELTPPQDVNAELVDTLQRTKNFLGILNLNMDTGMARDIIWRRIEQVLESALPNPTKPLAPKDYCICESKEELEELFKLCDELKIPIKSMLRHTEFVIYPGVWYDGLCITNISQAAGTFHGNRRSVSDFKAALLQYKQSA